MMLLLDTHAFLWLVEGNSKLSEQAGLAISDAANTPFLSIASVWEMAIKITNRKLKLDEALDRYVIKWTVAYQLELLPIKSMHAFAVGNLPDFHRDPFDRMLVG